MTADIEQIKKKIIYRSNYRGTKEMDKLLGAFTRKYLDQLNIEDLSILLKNGSYEFMSLIRIAYLLPKTKVKTLAGGNINKQTLDKRIPKYDLNTTINEYLDILEKPIKPAKNKINKKRITKKKT